MKQLKATHPDLRQQRDLTNKLFQINYALYAVVSKNLLDFVENGKNPILYIIESRDDLSSKYEYFSSKYCDFFVEKSVDSAIAQVEKNLIKNKLLLSYDAKSIAFNKIQQKNRLKHWVSSVPVVFFDKLAKRFSKSFYLNNEYDYLFPYADLKNHYISIKHPGFDNFFSESRKFISDKILNNFEITPKQMKDIVLSQGDLFNITNRRTKRIVIQEQLRIIGEVNAERYSNAGIFSYIWRTSEDERVVGNPKGLYPQPTAEHSNHYERNGKEFRFDSPPDDGHPGTAHNCRCVEIPIIKKKK